MGLGLGSILYSSDERILTCGRLDLFDFDLLSPRCLFGALCAMVCRLDLSDVHNLNIGTFLRLRSSRCVNHRITILERHLFYITNTYPLGVLGFWGFGVLGF